MIGEGAMQGWMEGDDECVGKDTATVAICQNAFREGVVRARVQDITHGMK